MSCSVDHDSISNVCTGSGRIKIRLGSNEDLDTVKLQYLKAGFAVAEQQKDARMKTKFTSEHSLKVQSPTRLEADHKVTKMGML